MIERYIIPCKHCKHSTEHDHIHNINKETREHIPGTERYTCRECQCSIYAEEAAERKLPLHFDL